MSGTRHTPPMDDTGRITRKQTFYRVAVWWPSGGYGGATDFGTPEKAEAERTSLLELGYKDVDVWKVTIDPQRRTVGVSEREG